MAASNCEELGLFEAIGSKKGKKTLAVSAKRSNVRENKNKLSSFKNDRTEMVVDVDGLAYFLG